jgi:hypothetical protein
MINFLSFRLPRLGNFLKTEKGETGITFRAYNEPPSVKDRTLADEFHLTNTELMMMDYRSPNITGPLWFADIEGVYCSSDPHKHSCASHSVKASSQILQDARG